MANLSPLSTNVTFDDLLKANKKQFDLIFSAQTKELGLVGSTHRPPTAADLDSASMASPPRGEASDLYAMLNGRFGSRWSSEVVEHKAERGAVTVLCKLTVDGAAKMQFGSARANGDEGAALRLATEAALRNCAGMFGDEAAVEARAPSPAAARPAGARPSGATRVREATAPAPRKPPA